MYISVQPYSAGQVLGASSDLSSDTQLHNLTTIAAKTAFDLKIETDTEELPFEVEFRDDPDVEYGEEDVIEPGKVGQRKTNYRITYWFDELLDREVESVEVVQPVRELRSRGTKVVWREKETSGGTIKYWRKLHVWATKYDGNCEGCRGLTYSGTRVVKGVCAVDPKVIPLGTNFWVDGYGMCRSEDIGGGVKGNHVDLGYEDVSKGAWRTGFTDVYLMSSAPGD
jgi:3D (Asp-Asp-Asp) domain-containing protein